MAFAAAEFSMNKGVQSKMASAATAKFTVNEGAQSNLAAAT